MSKAKTVALISAMAGALPAVAHDPHSSITGDALDALLGGIEGQAGDVVEQAIPADVAPVVEPTIEPAKPEVIELSGAPQAETPEQAKARIAAEKQAEKERKAKEKEEQKAAAKAEREKKAAEKKAAEKKAQKEAEKAAKPQAAKRIYFADRADRIAHRLGSDLGNYMVLEIADAALEGEALKAKQDETFAVIKAMNKKVKNRASLLLDYAAGKSKSLNSVISIAFKLLKRDGKLTTGDKGNYVTTLLSKNDVNPRPYSPGAARAMSNNTVSLLKQLKVITDGGEKQTYVPNPNSLIAAKINGMLGL